MNGAYQTATLTVDSVTWQPLVVPVDCDYVMVKNMSGIDCKFRTTEGDPLSEDTVPNFYQEILLAPFRQLHWGNRKRVTRFVVGDVFAYFQTVSGVITLKCRLVL